jgi:hypothetical protein
MINQNKMNITEAISILKIHQEWRLGADIVSIEPKELTAAIKVIINVLNPEIIEGMKLYKEQVKNKL